MNIFTEIETAKLYIYISMCHLTLSFLMEPNLLLGIYKRCQIPYYGLPVHFGFLTSLSSCCYAQNFASMAA